MTTSTTATKPYECPKSSPWGRIQEKRQIIPGMFFVSTAGHGGIKLSPALQRRMPDYMRCANGWYEEDCEWALPFLVFQQQILAETTAESCKHSIHRDEHAKTCKNWFPAIYERWTGKTLQPGESTTRDQETFDRDHAQDLVVVSASGDWHPAVPKGFVGVYATIGGTRTLGPAPDYAPPAKQTFLVPQNEYDARHRCGFVVDPSKHPAWNPEQQIQK